MPSSPETDQVEGESAIVVTNASGSLTGFTVMDLMRLLTMPCTLPNADYAQYAIDLSKLWGELLWTMTTHAASHGELVALVFGAYCAKHAIRHSGYLAKTLISSLRQRTI